MDASKAATFVSCGLLALMLGACGSQNPPSQTDAHKGTSFTGPASFDPKLGTTPGKLCSPSDPDFQEFRYPEHIAYCQRNVDDSEKAQAAQKYGIPEADFSQYEFDHLIPLSLGGSDSLENIWPQRLDAAHVKDQLEEQLYLELQAGKITQADAVKQIRAWKMK